MTANPGLLIDLIDNMEQLIRFQDRIETPPTIKKIWQVFLAEINFLISVQGCALFLVDEASHEFALHIASPETEASLFQVEIGRQIDSGMFSPIIRRRQPALLHSLKRENNHHVLLLPLTTSQKTVGVILAFTPLSEQSITPEKMKLLSILCQQCSLVMSNTLLYQNLLREQESLEQANKEIKRLSRIDPLTGCYNRGYLMERLPEEIKRSRRYNRPLSLIMCDIDHFKQVNDTYGHRAGDKILQAFVRCMADGIRKGIDWLARYGGEEFIVILPETTAQGAIVLANRLCKAVASRSIRLTDQSLSITASFGVTGFSTSDAKMEHSAGRMIETADRNLYAAKQAGRNTVKGTPLN